MYGVEIVNYRRTDLIELEKTQNKVARLALGAPKHTAVEGLRAEMGYSTWEERIAKSRFSFARKLETMDENRWARKMWLERGRDSKWRRETDKLERKWGTEGMQWAQAKE